MKDLKVPDTNKDKRILAIDYGKKRIGLALSDPLLTFAYPFKTIQNNNSKWNELTGIIKEKNVEKIILGFPYREDGKVSKLSGEISQFKEILKKKFKIEILLRDERYTSSIAEEMIKESVNKKKKRRDKGLVDRNAATVILQDYLNEITN